jgi:hypothetical protein
MGNPRSFTTNFNARKVELEQALKANGITVESLGNAVIPQIPELIGRAILESERAAA